MIDLVLVTGFLGSGKTTLLKRIHQQNTGRKLVFLVNEFSAKDVDAELLKDDNESVISVAGGSIFCTCKTAEFIYQLKWILANHKNTEKVIIEASGTANLLDVGKMLTDAGLEKQFRLGRIITIVDPVTLPKLLLTLPNIRRQLKCADYVLLNKADLAVSADRLSVQKTIKEINSQARLEETEYCGLKENILNSDSLGSAKTADSDAHPPQENYSKFSISSSRPINPQKLENLLKFWHNDIFRIK